MNKEKNETLEYNFMLYVVMKKRERVNLKLLIEMEHMRVLYGRKK